MKEFIRSHKDFVMSIVVILTFIAGIMIGQMYC